MASQTTSPLRTGQVLEISFPPFTPRITIHSERELTVEIIAGDIAGFHFRRGIHRGNASDGQIYASEGSD